jgi:signal transduction histidine kinase
MVTRQSPSFSVLAPLQRYDPPAIAQQMSLVIARMDAAPLLDGVSTGVLVLNDSRQIVYCNAAAAALTGDASRQRVYGLRPGEALDCRESHCPGGCGTNHACEFCGAARAIAHAVAGVGEISECRIVQAGTGGALDLRVSCSPLVLDGQGYVMVNLIDIADEKRRRALERVFFHDVRNVLGSLLGYLQLSVGDAPQSEYEAKALSAAIGLADEIGGFEELLRAEAGELAVQMQPLSLAEVCREVADLLRGHEVAHRRLIVLADTADVAFHCDLRMLRRVLINLTKNALEASPEGGEVMLAWGVCDAEAFVRVHNQGFMPREVQLQLFKRSFSTKGPGRGLGTYSVRLFAETYLGGRVTVSSSPEEGTTFTVFVPHR